MEQLPEGHWESRLKTGWVASFVWGLTTLGQPERTRQEVLPATKDQIRIEPQWHTEVLGRMIATPTSLACALRLRGLLDTSLLKIALGTCEPRTISAYLSRGAREPSLNRLTAPG